jgi:hypothetical protein
MRCTHRDFLFAFISFVFKINRIKSFVFNMA